MLTIGENIVNSLRATYPVVRTDAKIFHLDSRKLLLDRAPGIDGPLLLQRTARKQGHAARSAERLELLGG